jgi:hypothetical protein
LMISPIGKVARLAESPESKPLPVLYGERMPAGR